MVPITREDLDLESGLADDFDGTITAAFFGARSEYVAMSGTSDPMILLQIESPGLPEPVEQGWSCGAAKQWEVIEEGAEIVSGKNPGSHRFNMNSRAGQLVGAMIGSIGQGDKTKGQEFFVKRGYLMTQARFYTGLSFHWKRTRLPTVGGEERDVLLPTRFLGEAALPTARPEISAARPIRAGVPSKVSAIPDDIRNALIALTVGKTEREVKIALVRHPELGKNAELMNAVANKGYLAELEAADLIAKGPDGRYI